MTWLYLIAKIWCIGGVLIVIGFNMTMIFHPDKKKGVTEKEILERLILEDNPMDEEAQQQMVSIFHGKFWSSVFLFLFWPLGLISRLIGIIFS